MLFHIRSFVRSFVFESYICLYNLSCVWVQCIYIYICICIFNRKWLPRAQIPLLNFDIGIYDRKTWKMINEQVPHTDTHIRTSKLKKWKLESVRTRRWEKNHRRTVASGKKMNKSLNKNDVIDCIAMLVSLVQTNGNFCTKKNETIWKYRRPLWVDIIENGKKSERVNEEKWTQGT